MKLHITQNAKTNLYVPKHIITLSNSRWHQLFTFHQNVCFAFIVVGRFAVYELQGLFTFRSRAIEMQVNSECTVDKILVELASDYANYLVIDSSDEVCFLYIINATFYWSVFSILTIRPCMFIFYKSLLNYSGENWTKLYAACRQIWRSSHRY